MKLPLLAKFMKPLKLPAKQYMASVNNKNRFLKTIVLGFTVSTGHDAYLV